MKLDVNVLRYMSQEEFRVLTAVEMGQRNVSRRAPAALLPQPTLAVRNLGRVCMICMQLLIDAPSVPLYDWWL